MNEEARQLAEGAASDPWAIHWLTYLWVCLISAWGGLVRFLNAMKGKNEPVGAIVFNLCAGLCTSCFVGVLTFYACELASFNKLTTAICVAITGHMGSEGIRMIQSGVITRIRAAWLAAFNPPKIDSEGGE